MAFIGQLIRSLLNINTIWGLMILSAFVLCVVQHYQPTTTTLAAQQLATGDNTITITVTGQGDARFERTFTITRTGDQLSFDDAARTRNDKRLWLIAAERIPGGFRVVWDCPEHGDYAVALNGTEVRRGSLVTLQGLTDAAFDYARIGFDIALGLVATMVLFLGLMKVGEAAGIVQLVARVFRPLIRFLFPEIPKDHPASGAIVMNVTSTVLGLGNAATPFGLKAMQHLQELNPSKETATNAQVMLLAINTAGFAMIPTTLLAVRKSAGCSNPFEIIGTCMVAGATATVVAVIAAKLLGKLPFFAAPDSPPIPLTADAAPSFTASEPAAPPTTREDNAS
jgi:spore maturation protein A